MATTAERIKYQIGQERRNVPLAGANIRKGINLFARAISQVQRWAELSRQRRELAQLSDEMLKDIGLSRVDTLREANRPFWDDPRSFK